MSKLLALFIIVPVTEVIIYVQLGRYLGLWPTLSLILGTGIAGAILAKQQGFSLISQTKRDLENGIIPGNHLLDGLLVLAGGLLLLTPGLLTDISGFLLMFPVSRKHLREFLKKKMKKWIRDGKVSFYFR